jgi:hypothetical protein
MSDSPPRRFLAASRSGYRDTPKMRLSIGGKSKCDSLANCRIRYGDPGIGDHSAFRRPVERRVFVAFFSAWPLPSMGSSISSDRQTPCVASCRSLGLRRRCSVNKRPRLTPRSFGRSMAWLADRHGDPTPINILRDCGRRLHHARCFPRRNLRAKPVLSLGTVSDRSAGDRIGLLLPSRGDLGRLHRPDADAASQPLDFTVRILIATRGAAVVLVVNLQFSLETRGEELVPQLTLVAESSAV